MTTRARASPYGSHFLHGKMHGLLAGMCLLQVLLARSMLLLAVNLHMSLAYYHKASISAI